MAILFKSQIENAIGSDDNQFDAWCHWDGKEFHQKPKAASSDADAKAQFLDRIEGVRTRLSLGPLLKTLTHAPVAAAGRYMGLKDTFKLDKGSTYDLAPGESIATFTAERIRLPLNVAGYIVSRVTNDANGLTVKTSYLTNGWDGLIKLRLKNESRDTIKLHLGMEVAALFLIQVVGSVGAKAADYQAAHFGRGWDRIIGDNKSPFEDALEKAKPKNAFESVGDVVSGFIARDPLKAGLSLLVSGGVAGFVWTAAVYSTRLAEFEENYTKLEDARRQMGDIQTSLGRMPWADTASLNFAAGDAETVTTLRLARAPSRRAVVFASVSDVQVLDGGAQRLGDYLVSARIDQNDDDARLVIRVLRGGAVQPPAVVAVNYAVIEPAD